MQRPLSCVGFRSSTQPTTRYVICKENEGFIIQYAEKITL